MALAELQRALAHLYTDERARERFRADPHAFARGFDLGPGELAQLNSIGDARLHAYADSLDKKRANECERMLPLSAAVLGPRFRREFLRYARAVPLGTGSRRYRNDAAAFAAFALQAPVARELSEPAKSLLRYEANVRPGIAFYGYFAPELARRAASGLRIDDAAPCRTAVVRMLGRSFAFRA